VFDVATGRQERVLRDNDISQVAFSPDGSIIAAAVGLRSNNTGKVDFWDTAEWRQRGSLTVPYVPAGVVFVNGGSSFATMSFPAGTASEPPTRVDLWDTRTLQPIGEPLTVPTTAAFLLLANGPGTKVTVGSHSGVLTALDVNLNAWQAAACRIAGRNLTRAEWAHYLTGQPYHVTCPQWPAGR
jgi:hypothetical protein